MATFHERKTERTNGVLDMTPLSSEAVRLADELDKWARDYATTDYTEDMATKSAALLRRIPELEADAAIHKARLFEALESEPTLKAAEEQVNDCMHRPTFMDMSKLLDVASANFTERKRVEAERDQLRAELDARWQPIETAPKDGTLFLCWVSAVRYGETDEGQQYQQDASQVDFCQWLTQSDIPDCGWFDPCCGQIADQQHVTHWMPLPAAPTPPHADQKGQ